MKLAVKLLVAALLSCGLMLQAASPVPRPAGSLKSTDQNGQKLDIASYKGKVVLVQFLFTWCPHCAAFAEKLTVLQNELGPKGLQVVGVAFNDEDMAQGKKADKAEIGRFKAAHAGFPVGYASRQTVQTFLGFSVMDRMSVPLIAIIDRNGVIQYQDQPTPVSESQSMQFLHDKLGKLLDGKAESKSGAKAAPPKTATAKPGA